MFPIRTNVNGVGAESNEPSVSTVAPDPSRTTDAPRPPVLSPSGASAPVPGTPPIHADSVKRAGQGETHPATAILLFLLVVFVGAAFIAPRFHASAQFLAEGNHAWRKLADQPFHRYVGRCLLLLGVIGLPVLLKSLKIRTAAALGLHFRWRNWVEAAHGFAWGFATLLLITALSISFQSRALNLDHSAADWMRHLRGAALTAIIVALLEEFLFRGALFGALRRQYTFWSAALASSALYALLHFFERPQGPAYVEWYSGFVTLGEMLRGFLNWHALIPGFFNLLLFGTILAMALERTGSLLFSIGLHASLVFWLKLLGFLTEQLPSAKTSVWGSNKLVDGWASGLVLLGVFIVLRSILPQRQERHA